MKTFLSAALSLIFVIIIFPVKSSTHVLIQDKQASTGILMHVSPEDNPYARTKTNIYFDIQNENLNSGDYLYRLEIGNSLGNVDSLNLTPSGESSIIGSYVFPDTGTYRLRLEAKPSYISGIKSEPLYFEFTQEVNRLRKQSTASNHQVLLKYFAAICVIIAIGSLIQINKKGPVQ